MHLCGYVDCLVLVYACLLCYVRLKCWLVFSVYDFYCVFI